MKILRWGLGTFILILAVVVYLIPYYLGKPSLARISLQPDTSLKFHVWRLQTEPVELSIYFYRDFGKFRDELGRGGDGGSFVEGGQRFPFPGEPVEVLANVNGRRLTLFAMPARAADMEHWERELVPAVGGADPNQVKWPLEIRSFPQLQIGLNSISLHVTNVGKPLIGERVDVYLRAPMSRHRHAMVQPDYSFFSWFSTITAVLLLVCAIAVFLLWGVSRTKNETENSSA
jgi:hypothetical protein